MRANFDHSFGNPQQKQGANAEWPTGYLEESFIFKNIEFTKFLNHIMIYGTKWFILRFDIQSGPDNYK